MERMSNKSLHWIFTPLRSIAACEMDWGDGA